ncbi:hypothetical protein, partial [Nocardioides humilatus]|uniref:hypothetical protein n=1 Tax=Nocardioides humilatus TaxID=2607660 RepID=UPI001CB71EF1
SIESEEEKPHICVKTVKIKNMVGIAKKSFRIKRKLQFCLKMKQIILLLVKKLSEMRNMDGIAKKSFRIRSKRQF